MQVNPEAFIRLANDPVKFRLFMLSKLPSAFFAGVRIKNMSQESCTVQVPFNWFTQNPFRSTYFACLAMAAELSTGALFMAHTYKSSPSISMLVTRMQSDFIKKSTGVAFFVCNDGQRIREVVKRAVESGAAQTFEALSTGRNRDGEIIAEFRVTWSLKARTVERTA